MRLVQALRKLGKVQVHGYNIATASWDTLTGKALLESSQRWISERVGFNARRVLLTDFSLGAYRTVKISEDDVEHILYSEQRNIQGSTAFLYDYTVLDKTDEVVTVTFQETQTASGQAGDVVEILSDPFPIHRVRYAKADSEVMDHQVYSRSYAFAPNNIAINTSQELQVGTDRFIIEEADDELLTTRLMITKR